MSGSEDDEVAAQFNLQDWCKAAGLMRKMESMLSKEELTSLDALKWNPGTHVNWACPLDRESHYNKQLPLLEWFTNLKKEYLKEYTMEYVSDYVKRTKQGDKTCVTLGSRC